MQQSENEAGPSNPKEAPFKSRLNPEAPPFVPRRHLENIAVVAGPSAAEDFSINNAFNYEPPMHFHRLRADKPAYERWGATMDAFPVILTYPARNVFKKIWRVVPITAPTSLTDSVYITACKEKHCDLATWSPIKFENFCLYYKETHSNHKNTTDRICHTCHCEWQCYQRKCEIIQMLLNRDLTISVNNNCGAIPLIETTAQKDYLKEAKDIEMQSNYQTIIQNNGFVCLYKYNIPEVSAYGLYPNTPPYEYRTIYDHCSDEIHMTIMQPQEYVDNESELEMLNFCNETTDDTIKHCNFCSQLPKDAYFKPISPVGRQPGNQNDQPLVLNGNILTHRQPLCDISNTSDSPPACDVGFTHQPRNPGDNTPRSFVDYKPSTQPDMNIIPNQVTYNAGLQLEDIINGFHFTQYFKYCMEEPWTYNKYTYN